MNLERKDKKQILGTSPFLTETLCQSMTNGNPAIHVLCPLAM